MGVNGFDGPGISRENTSGSYNDIARYGPKLGGRSTDISHTIEEDGSDRNADRGASEETYRTTVKPSDDGSHCSTEPSIVTSIYAPLRSYRRHFVRKALGNVEYYGTLYHNPLASNKGIIIVIRGVNSGETAYRRYKDGQPFVTLKSFGELDFEYVLSATSPYFLLNVSGMVSSALKAAIIFDVLHKADEYIAEFKIQGNKSLIAMSHGSLMFHEFSHIAMHTPSYMQALSRLRRVVLCSAPRSIANFQLNAMLNAIDNVGFSVFGLRPIRKLRRSLSKAMKLIMGRNLKDKIYCKENLTLPGINLPNMGSVDYCGITWPEGLLINYVFEYGDQGISIHESFEDYLSISPDTAGTFCISNPSDPNVDGHGQIYKIGGNMKHITCLFLDEMWIDETAQASSFLYLNRPDVLMLAETIDELNPKFSLLTKTLESFRDEARANG